MNINLRKLGAGDWYWINKAVIQMYAGTISFSEVTVYNFLASMADENQRCFPSQKYIAEHLGCSRATIHRAIQKLEKSKLIMVDKKSSNHHVYYLLALPCSTEETPMSHERNQGAQKIDTNNTNKQELENNSFVGAQKNIPEYFHVTTRQELLANDIADILNDHEHHKTYLSFANKYPEVFLRKILSEVKQIPERKIRKSRKALFMYLVNYYAHKTT